ncbi:MAG TPA: hypothetical protein VGJ09_03570 [Bryobacteraceae bacterium]
MIWQQVYTICCWAVRKTPAANFVYWFIATPALGHCPGQRAALSYIWWLLPAQDYL